jgi:hypothetical protein
MLCFLSRLYADEIIYKKSLCITLPAYVKNSSYCSHVKLFAAKVTGKELHAFLYNGMCK